MTNEAAAELQSVVPNEPKIGDAEVPAIDSVDDEQAGGAAAEEMRLRIREQLAADVDAFLAGGGQIEEVPSDFRADPPRKPEPKYGGGSI